MSKSEEYAYEGQFTHEELDLDSNKLRLVFDTETTGFPSQKLDAIDSRQNVVVELGASLVDISTWKVQQSMSVIIRTPRPFISQFVVDVHGITNEFSMAVGCDADLALELFINLCKAANWALVGHNVKFDKDMMEIMLKRSPSCAKHLHDFSNANFYCTMNRAAPVVNLPPTEAMRKFGRTNPKPPKLEEAYRFFYPDRPMFDAHRVSGDVQATIDVYRKLIEGDY